jgi:predicted transcriptional regulator
MPRRSESDIIVAILLKATNESTRTKILHRTNLNQKTFSRYFNKLLVKKFIEPIDSEGGFKHYRITSEGKGLLKKMRETTKMMKD